MARPTLNLTISLENVHCYDEGDGWGSAEPYLWPVFFKIDGDNYAVETGAGLIGFPVIQSRNGHHENLNNNDVDAGNNVPVPDSLGTWRNNLKPIPINDPVIKSLIGDDLPGIAGVVVVLMEQDGWPDDLADTGYNALVNAVTLAVAQVAAGFQHATHAPTKDEIDAAIKTVKDTAAGMVRDSVKAAMSGWQLFWYGTFGNNDDSIGSEAWTFSHEDFATNAFINFNRHWDSDEAGDGDWEISGSATGVAPCPADALSGLLSGLDGRAGSANSGHGSFENIKSKSLLALRNFRAKEYAALPGLEPWWRALHSGTTDLIRIVVRNPAIGEAAKRLFKGIPDVLTSLDRPLSAEHLNDIKTILEEISKKSPRLSDAFAHQALAVIPKLKGKTWKAALQYVSDTKIITEQEEKKIKRDSRRLK